jgi:hypothetical protein
MMKSISDILRFTCLFGSLESRSRMLNLQEEWILKTHHRIRLHDSCTPSICTIQHAIRMTFSECQYPYQNSSPFATSAVSRNPITNCLIRAPSDSATQNHDRPIIFTKTYRPGIQLSRRFITQTDYRPKCPKVLALSAKHCGSYLWDVKSISCG